MFSIVESLTCNKLWLFILLKYKERHKSSITNLLSGYCDLFLSGVSLSGFYHKEFILLFQNCIEEFMYVLLTLLGVISKADLTAKPAF